MATKDFKMGGILASALTNADWKRLNELNLVDGVGNGFANTTKNFDDNIWCSSIKPTKIKICGTAYTYLVMYVSGCFYPVWAKAFLNDCDFIVEKNGKIAKNTCTNQK